MFRKHNNNTTKNKKFSFLKSGGNKKSERIVVDFCNSCYTIHSVLHRMYLRYKKGREVQWDFDKLPEKDFIFYSSGRFLGF